MSGGSYSYICDRLSEECESRMYDVEMNDFIKDLCKVLHDLEWWQSGDISEEKYRQTLSAFKKKWFKGDRKQRLKGYIDEQIGIVRSQLCSLIGEPQESEKEMGEWIPVSERLPEENKSVIVSTEYGVVYPDARYTKKYGWEWAYEAGADYWEELEDEDVTAWMPLPEPYKTESEDKE